jgi:hypothetical protein
VDGSSAFHAWHFFVLVGLAAATVAVFMATDTSPANLILISLTIGASALAAIAVHRTLSPLVAASAKEGAATIGQRTRVALEREKMLVLRSIKELEFDRAMGKVSNEDFDVMVARLRTRALTLIRQLDDSASGYRQLIMRDLQARIRSSGSEAAGPPPAAVPDRPPAPLSLDSLSQVAPGDRASCAACGASNEPDARFCKQCGARVDAA